jgi:predicted ribosome quality control (RQC) complex YloA/Tae2 family protein
VTSYEVERGVSREPALSKSKGPAASRPGGDARLSTNKVLGAENMSEELTELEEHAEHGREHPDLAPVTLSMAVLAVLVATVSLLGHRTHTEEIILQNRVSDQWAFYQAKNIRRHNDELFADLTTVVASKDAEAVAKLHERYQAEADRYKDEQKELDTKARELEKEGELTRRKADRFDLAEVFLEIALVVSSITLLSGRRIFWHFGLLMAAAGILVAASVWMLH